MQVNGAVNVEFLLQRLIDEVAEIKQRIAQVDTAQSSVQLATSTRGVDVTVKCYAGSPVVQAGDAALDEYLRLREHLEVSIMAALATEAKRRA